jgi:hypothetical protein
MTLAVHASTTGFLNRKIGEGKFYKVKGKIFSSSYFDCFKGINI